MPTDADLLDQWRQAFARPTEGWDFSHLTGLSTDEPPWSYDDLARHVVAGATSALDLGTGGGEVLLDLVDALPPGTVATEGWPPNLPVAREALAPHGIEVVAYDAEQDPAMPFPDGSFDVVLSRHEAYDAAEAFRVLAPGGRLLTQQVDGRDSQQMQQLFGGSSPYLHVRLDRFAVDAQAVGLEVELAEEWAGSLRFADVDTLVGYLAMVPWEVPEDFAVDRYADDLLALHHSGRSLVFTQRRFVLACRKPG